MLYFLICLPIVVIVGTTIFAYNRRGFQPGYLVRSMLIAAAISLAVSGTGVYLRAIAFPDASYELAGPFKGAGEKLESFSERATKNKEQKIKAKSSEWGGDFWAEYRKNIK